MADPQFFFDSLKKGGANAHCTYHPEDGGLGIPAAPFTPLSSHPHEWGNPSFLSLPQERLLRFEAGNPEVRRRLSLLVGR